MNRMNSLKTEIYIIAIGKHSSNEFPTECAYIFPYILELFEQVLIFRLRTKHNRLRHHLFHKFRIGETDQCPCGTGSQTTEHILQTCPLLDTRRRKVWPEPVPETQKLYGALWDLQRTAYYISDAGVAI